MTDQADVIIVGAGLAGLVAAAELADGGKRVIIVEQEAEQSLGGQAFWSFGGLFFVDSPEQRRMGIHDSVDLAWPKGNTLQTSNHSSLAAMCKRNLAAVRK